MSAPVLQRQAPGRFTLSGELSFATVPGLVAAGDGLFDGADEVTVDLSAVARSDSAGLALLVSWVRAARRRDKRLGFHRVPQQLLGLARVSGVDELLSLDA